MRQSHLLGSASSSLDPAISQGTASDCVYSPILRWAGILALLAVFTACEKRSEGVIDSESSFPVLLQASITPSLINSDSINVGGSRQPDDILPISVSVIARLQRDRQSIPRVHYSIRSTDSLDIITQGFLQDDGVGPDQGKGDGLFSGKAEFQIRRVQVGTFTVQINAETPSGSRSNTYLLPLQVYRGNQPPSLSDLQGPNSVQLGNQSQVILLSVRAADPDGLNDVARVVFNSFKPDGSPSGGNPFHMYDDGLPSHGDERASDGVFSLLVSLPPNTQPGIFRFEFQAFDRSGSSSIILALQITVKP